MILRPAAAADVLAIHGKLPDCTMRAYVAVIDGQPLAIGGVYYAEAGTFAFCQITDAMRARRKSIMRAARLVMGIVRQFPGPIYALCSRQEETAAAFLKRLGFEFMEPTAQGNVYRLGGT